MAELPPVNNSPSNPDAEAVPIGEILPRQSSPAIERKVTGRWRGLTSVFGWIFRWALLGVGAGGVWFLGVLAAQFFPAPEPEPPLQEIMVRRTNRFVQKLRRFPSWWAGEERLATRPISVPQLQSAPAVPPPAVTPIPLSAADRQQITVELEAVERDLQQLRDRTSALETQLGLPALERPLEERLGNVANRVSPPSESEQPNAQATGQSTDTEVAAPNTPISAPVPGPTPDPLFQVDAYRVTLPGDVLFTPGETVLQTNAQPLLDNILLDIGRYQGASVLVGSYTDAQAGQTDLAAVSYQQALAVKRYLSQRLGDDSYHWVAVGYGDTSLGTTGDSQLSRRITIAIVP